MKSFVVILLGLEPIISSFITQCLIHWAIGANKAKITKALSSSTIVRTTVIKQGMWYALLLGTCHYIPIYVTEFCNNRY